MKVSTSALLISRSVVVELETGILHMHMQLSHAPILSRMELFRDVGRCQVLQPGHEVGADAAASATWAALHQVVG